MPNGIRATRARNIGYDFRWRAGLTICNMAAFSGFPRVLSAVVLNATKLKLECYSKTKSRFDSLAPAVLKVGKR